jgi:hypothetical protein
VRGVLVRPMIAWYTGDASTCHNVLRLADDCYDRSRR